MSDIILKSNAQAFGDGSHPTTRGMLAAIEALDPEAFAPRIACDMGAGSGILALAIARKFRCPVVAADIERQSIEIVKENFELAGLSSLVVPVHTDGFSHTEITVHAPYDLIVMNILAEPLMKLSSGAVSVLAEEGVLMLSGILKWQESQLIAACEALNLVLSSRITVGDWVTLIFQKPSLI